MRANTKTLLLFAAGGALAFWLYKRSKQKTGTSGMGDLGRDSCTECVEKHLGAAAVLIEECKTGYPHRLRAIGHLHEAEDESRAWPELCNAIRQARLKYQREGKCPVFEALEAKIAEVKGPSKTDTQGLGCVPCAALLLL